MKAGYRGFLAVFAFTVLLAGLSYQVSAQDTGSISGTVRDASGAVIPNTTVTATNVATAIERTVQTGGIGQYALRDLPPGNYKVRVSNPSFKTFETTVEVTVGGTLTLDPQLEVGSSTAVVEVVAGAGTEVNTQTQELSQLVDSSQLAHLPSLTRNPYDFVALSGNVSSGDNTTNQAATMSSNSGQSLSNRGVGFSINGQRESGTEILLDGVENIGIFSAVIGQPVPTDSIQEYSVITNNYGAEYGRASGGVVNVDSRPGSNSYHGSVFEYNRLSAYTANTFNNDVNGLPKGTYTRNQFGFNAGGPIIKNKLFASFSQEWVRVRSSSSQTEEVLDPAFISMLPSNIQSYFSSFGTGAAPASGKVTTAGQLAGTTAAPNGFPLINGVTPVPASTPVFDTVNFKAPFDAGGGVPNNTYNLLGRIDFNMTNKTQMFFRYARYNETDFNGATFYSAYPQYNVGGTFVDNSGLFSITHSISDALLSNSKISFARFDTNNSFDTTLAPTPNLYLSQGTPVDPVTGTLIQMPGLENIAVGVGGLPFGGPQNTAQAVQDIAWTKGRHNMRFGGEFTYIQLNQAYGAYNQAVEQLGQTLGGGLNSLVNAGGVTDPSSGTFASPLFAFTARVNSNGTLPCNVDIYGNPIVTPSCTVTPPLGSASFARSYRYKDWALYAQDSFRVSRKLTLNYALRYEHYGVQHNDNQSLDSNFYVGASGPGGFAQSIRNGQVEITTQSPIGQFWEPRWGTVAPRVGFAYDLFGNGKTSLRGGIGISYERNFGNVTYNASFNPPASFVLSDNCSANSSAVITNCGFFATVNDKGPLGLPGAPAPLPPAELRYNDDHINVAQTQFWSLAVEREVARNTIVAVSYSGAHGIHLYDLNNYNNIGGAQAYLGDPLVTGSNAAGETCPFSNPTTGVPTCYTRPNSQYAAINDRGSNGTSSYNALNVKFQSQDLHRTGLSVIANYTWAHSLDDISSTFSDSLQGGSGFIGPLGYTDPTHPKLDWGSSDYDIRHRIVLSPIWQTPWYKSGRGFLPQTLGGWIISGIFTARTGVPFSVFDYSYDLTGYVVPRLIPATPITQFHTGTPVNVGPNLYNALTIPAPAPIGPLNPTLGISDYGPFPSSMTARNAFRGPGAWNTDLAVQKDFKLTERFLLTFRAEGFDIFNHHNYYVNPTTLAYFSPTSPAMQVTEEKGGLGTLATGGNHDERRFGQFSLRLNF